MLDHGSDLCLPGAGEGSSSDRPDQDFKIIKMTRYIIIVFIKNSKVKICNINKLLLFKNEKD